jgi:hypothetical protein
VRTRMASMGAFIRSGDDRLEIGQRAPRRPRINQFVAIRERHIARCNPRYPNPLNYKFRQRQKRIACQRCRMLRPI